MVSTSSFMLGILGGLVDFASATTMAINQGSKGMIAGYLLSVYGWAAVLVALGILAVATAVLSVTSTGVSHLKGFSVAMAFLGLVMAAVGSVMSSGLAQGTSLIYGYGMVIVGILMAINGVLMLRSPMPV